MQMTINFKMRQVNFILLIYFLVVGLPNEASAIQLKMSVKELKINTKEFREKGKMSELFEITRVIPLQTSDNCLINTISKVKISDSGIFVFDNRSRKILLFNHKGDFICQIGQHGGGPGEYRELMDFDIDPRQGFVYLLDFKSVHQYTFSGAFVKSHKINFMASKMQIDNNGFVFYGGQREDRVILTGNHLVLTRVTTRFL